MKFERISNFFSWLLVITLLSQTIVPALPVEAWTSRQAPLSLASTTQQKVTASLNAGPTLDQALYTAYLPSIHKNHTFPVATILLEPGVDSSFTSPNGQQLFRFIGKNITQTISLTYAQTTAPNLPPGDLAVAGSAFSLSAKTLSGEVISALPQVVTSIPGTEEKPSYSIITPTIQIELPYTDEMVSGLDLRVLFLYGFDPEIQSWYRVPSATYQEEKVVRAHVEQLGTFVLMADLSSRLLQNFDDNIRIALDPDDNDASMYWEEFGETWYEGALNYSLAEQIRQNFVTQECHLDILITRDASQQMGSVSRNLRAQAAINYEAVMFPTLAFNKLFGPWGYEENGGMRVWHRASHSDDTEFAAGLVSNLHEFTGRPSAIWSSFAFYNEYHTLPMIYSHSETLFMDHNYDRYVIHEGFNVIADAISTAVAVPLTEMGLTCGEDNLPPTFPGPPSADVLQRWRDLGYQSYLKYGADPVNFSTGNFVFQDSLFSIPGRNGLDFNFNIFYNAQDLRDDVLGYGWSFPYNIRIQRYNDDSASIALDDGRTFYYPWNGAGYEQPDGVYEELRRTSDGWQWETIDGTVLTFFETITGLGILTNWQDRQGNSLTFSHDLSGEDEWQNGNEVPRPPLVSISNDAGHTIEVATDDNGRITGFNLLDGRTVFLTYDNDGNLTHITNTTEGIQQFTYDSRHRMTSLRDADNILYLQNIYDSHDRVVEQIDADGNHLFLNYAATNQATLNPRLQLANATGQTTYIDNLGNAEIYYYDDLNRVVGHTDGRGYTEYYTYDDNYNLLSSTDRNGQTSYFGYDAQGNLTYLEEPVDEYSGQIYQTDISRWLYNDENLVISYTNALNNSWLYQYDANGNLIYVRNPDQTETTALYNNWGHVTSITDANGRTTGFIYDQAGNLVRTNYPDGTFSTSTYDINGRETSFTDANGHTVYFTYDGRDNISQIRDPKGQDSFFIYDPNDLLIQATDRRGGVSAFQFDNNLKLTGERDAEHNWSFYDYDAMYNRISKTDALGSTTLYIYDEAYNLISVTDANGGITRFEYDANGNLIAVIYPLNRSTYFIYDAMNRVKFMIDAEGNSTEFCYDAEDQLVRMFDPRRAKTDYVYDEVGNLVQMIDPYGEITQYEHDAVGNIVAIIDALNQRTDFSYDLLDRLVRIENPVLTDGQRPSVEFGYDNVGNTIEAVDELGRVTSLLYDSNDNVVAITDPAGGLTSYAYDQEDNPISVIDANGHLFNTTYNSVGLPTAVSDSLGQTTFITYDAVYNTVSVTDPIGRIFSYEYDPLGRMIQTSDPLDNFTQYFYDMAGQVVQMLDANGNLTGYNYDLVGHLISVTDALSGTTSYTYDAVGNLLTILDANQNLTSFEYNLYNQITREINPLEGSWTYSYDPLSRLIRRTDANFKATYYSYDSNGRLTNIQYGGQPHHTAPITFTHDLAGNELMMCDGLGCHSSSYDLLNRPVTTTDWLGRSINRSYDAVGNLTALTYPDGRVVTYSHNAANWLTAVSLPGNLTSSYDYNAAGQVTHLTHANNNIATFGYDGAGRLTSLDHRQMGAAEPQSAYSYMLDGVGNRTQVIETRAAFDGSANTVELTHNYQYDALNRLVNAATVAPDSNTQYSFDSVGNRLQKSGTVLVPDDATPELPVAPRSELVNYSHNAANQLLATDTTNFVYDPNGNRIQQTEIITNGKLEITSYLYNREDRLIGVTKHLSDTTGITLTMEATYTYDGYGRRAFKEVTYPATISPTITTTQQITYLYNGLDIIGAELNQNGVITESYYYLAPSPLTGMWRPFAMERLNTGETFWYQLDGLDSVVSLTDATGEIVESHLYDEYGTQLTNFSDLQLFVYSSQDYDPETRFYQFYARYYDSLNGLWLTQDRYRGQLSNSQTLHRYGYVHQNPINLIDVYGFFAFSFIFTNMLRNTANNNIEKLTKLYKTENCGRCAIHDRTSQTQSYVYGKGRKQPIDYIVIHGTGIGEVEGNIRYLQDNKAPVSAHYVVGKDGTVYQLVNDEDTAYHATHYNARSIGIEVVQLQIENSGKYEEYTPQQKVAMEKLVAYLSQRYSIPSSNIISHQEVDKRAKQLINQGELGPNNYSGKTDGTEYLAELQAQVEKCKQIYERIQPHQTYLDEINSIDNSGWLVKFQLNNNLNNNYIKYLQEN